MTTTAAVRRSSPRPGAVTLIGAAALAVYLAAFTWVSASSTYTTWGAFLVGPALLAVSVPLLLAASRSLPPWFFQLAFIALLLKLTGSLARYWVAFGAYGGVADAAGYHGWGVALSEQYAAGNFGADIGRDLIGTGFVRVLTGLVYVVTGPTLIGGYLVYSWIGFWGLILAVHAFRVGLPTGDLRRYSLLVLFLPSLLFWPSGLGKEAWMLFGVGLAMYGAASVLNRSAGGLIPLALGLVATSLVRPHVTVLLVGALLVAVALRRSPAPTPLTPLLKGLAVVLVIGLAVVAVLQTASFLGLEDVSVGSLQGEFETRTENTAQGGSEYAGAAVTNPLLLPWAVITVLFRPFPWEAGGAFALLSSLEGVLLIVLTWQARHRLAAIPRMLRSHPYVAFCLAYLLMFVLLFSGFSNFGILVRQRSLVLPAFLVLLVLPAVAPQVKRATTRARRVARGSGRRPGTAAARSMEAGSA